MSKKDETEIGSVSELEIYKTNNSNLRSNMDSRGNTRVNFTSNANKLSIGNTRQNFNTKSSQSQAQQQPKEVPKPPCNLMHPNLFFKPMTEKQRQQVQ